MAKLGQGDASVPDTKSKRGNARCQTGTWEQLTKKKKKRGTRGEGEEGERANAKPKLELELELEADDFVMKPVQ